MNKVVYNNCFGGFGLSNKAIELFLTKKDVKFKNIEDGYILLESNEILDKKSIPYIESIEGFLFFDMYLIPRHDKKLVEVVEELGKEANSGFSNLQIKEIEGDTYIIDEYEGNEMVLEPKDIQWIKIK